MGKVNFRIQNTISLIHDILSICYAYAMPLSTRENQTLSQTPAQAQHMLSMCSVIVLSNRGVGLLPSSLGTATCSVLAQHMQSGYRTYQPWSWGTWAS